MSTNHHTAFAPNYALTKANWNAPLSQLDTVITNAQAGTQAYSGLLLEAGSLGASALTGSNATDKGHRIPAMTTDQRDAIPSPATGLLVFNITTGIVNVYNGSSWEGAGGSIQYALLDEGESSNVASVVISGISQAYQDLILVGHVRSRSASSPDNVRFRLNADATSDAHETRGLFWTSTTTTNYEAQVGATSINGRLVPDANTDAEWYSNFMLTIPFYARIATEVGGWFYETHRSESDNLFYRQVGGWVYRHATSTAVASITLLSEDGANVDVKFKLYGRGVT